MAAPSLCAEMGAAAGRALAQLPAGPTATALAAVKTRLTERTLRVAVGGRMNAGKSTLVNALLGQRLAATGATETTRVVTWYRYHHQNRVRVLRRDGTELTLPAGPGGGMPATLPVPFAEIASVVVEVANARLADQYTVLDTPGLDSLTGLDPVARDALDQIDVLLYLMPHPGRNDLDLLASLRGTAAASTLTAVNVLGVLSRIDTLGDGRGDPWPAARRVAGRYADELRGLVAGIVPPVVPRLPAPAARPVSARTSRTGALRKFLCGLCTRQRATAHIPEWILRTWQGCSEPSTPLTRA
jgi:hypothetical protein